MTNLTDYRAEQIADEAARRLEQTLKPCPFCGGEARIFHAPFCGFDEVVVKCSNDRCGAIRNAPRAATDVEAVAIEAWNTRAERACRDQLDGRDPCVFVCSLCEHITDHAEDERPNYCPNCGAKVVEE